MDTVRGEKLFNMENNFRVNYAVSHHLQQKKTERETERENERMCARGRSCETKPQRSW